MLFLTIECIGDFSILVPIDETPGISILYIFVDIQVNVQHLIDTLKHHFTAESKLALVSTIQFVRTLQVKKNDFWNFRLEFVCELDCQRPIERSCC